MSEWGDIIDEMSDRMANQPSLIRKFAKERYTETAIALAFVLKYVFFSTMFRPFFGKIEHVESNRLSRE